MLAKLGLCLFRHTLPGTHNTRRGRYSNKHALQLGTPSGMAVLGILKVGWTVEGGGVVVEVHGGITV